MPKGTGVFSFSFCCAGAPCQDPVASREKRARCRLGPRMAPPRGSEQRLAFKGTCTAVLVMSGRGVPRNIDSDNFERREVAAPTRLASTRVPEPSLALARPSTCTQCALQNRPGSQIRGAPLPGPGGGQGWSRISGCRVWGLSWEIEARPRHPGQGAVQAKLGS
jgi:hypothetical protein